MVTLLFLVVRQFLKKDTKYWKTVVYIRACCLGDLACMCFPSPFPDRMPLLHKLYNDFIIKKGNPIVI